MPMYDYRCEDCGHEFEIDEPMAKHDETRQKCSECGSENVSRVFQAFVQTSSKT
ncbi:MAG: zinc ribbon domain-containing protein [Gemmatimonadota bacterium]|nr:zinc ribbon domain-containing protein [Gemmatimonadota bacterium]